MKRITLLIVLLWQVCLAFAQWGPQSKVESHTFHSKVLGSDREYTIYFPKSYAVEQDRKYLGVFPFGTLYMPALCEP